MRAVGACGDGDVGTIQPVSDVAEIVRIVNAAFRTVANDFHYTRQQVPGFPAFIGEDVIRNQQKQGAAFFGYYHEDQLAGTIAIRDTGKNGVYEVERFAVLPEYRHRQIGGTLMDYAEQEILARGGTYAEVEIVNENLRLREWYLGRLGFCEIRVDVYPHLPFTVGVLRKRVTGMRQA